MCQMAKKVKGSCHRQLRIFTRLRLWNAYDADHVNHGLGYRLVRIVDGIQQMSEMWTAEVKMTEEEESWEMGTDVNLFVERWRKKEWVHVDPPIGTPFFSYSVTPSSLELLAAALEDDPVPQEVKDWHIDRDYRLFGMLAGVRTNDLVLKEKCGLPLDVSTGVSTVYDNSYNYGPTHFYLGELTHLVAKQDWREYNRQVHIALEKLKLLIECMGQVRDKYGLDDQQVRAIMWFD